MPLLFQMCSLLSNAIIVPNVLRRPSFQEEKRRTGKMIGDPSNCHGKKIWTQEARGGRRHFRRRANGEV